jgi:hypothetical protein
MRQRYRATRAEDWFRMERDEAEEHACPFCEAAIGETCVNTRIGGEVNFPAHSSRLTLARKARKAAREQAEAEGRQP